jgi:hypothetical protein
VRYELPAKRNITRDVLLLIFLLAAPVLMCGQTNSPAQVPVPKQVKTAPEKPPRISLSPRFSPGQSFLYQMKFENTTTGSRSGLASDPQGPSKLTITWDTTIRLDILTGESAVPGSFRLRISYDKSSADVRSDSFDPDAAGLQDQYSKLAGKQIEFMLDGNGKVLSVTGLEDVVQGDQALEDARRWLTQITSGPDAPDGGVMEGQKWSSDEAADSLPIAGLAWHSESEYLRNEPCHLATADQANPAPAPSTANEVPIPASLADAGETCAVILSSLNLISPKSLRDPTPQPYQQNGMKTAGKVDGAGQSLSYISLKTGLVVSVTQTSNQTMDVTFTTPHFDSFHYAGTILSHSQVSMVNSTPAL